jgi:hypothetical protein
MINRGESTKSTGTGRVDTRTAQQMRREGEHFMAAPGLTDNVPMGSEVLQF